MDSEEKKGGTHSAHDGVRVCVSDDAIAYLISINTSSKYIVQNCVIIGGIPADIQCSLALKKARASDSESQKFACSCVYSSFYVFHNVYMNTNMVILLLK